jgi:hypothetical protein
MHRLDALHTEIVTRYSYDRSEPKKSKEGYWVYSATHNDLRIPMTLKVLAMPSDDLLRYLKRLKEMKMDHVVKIYELFEHPEGIFLAQEQVSFGTLKFALQKCRKLDDFDAIFLSKVLLCAHADLMRQGINWFGTEEDIEFTDSGMKLSWNNSIPYE